jgi:hypothetical protein
MGLVLQLNYKMLQKFSLGATGKRHIGRHMRGRDDDIRICLQEMG